jgi:phosphatidylserine decarboxylase
MKTKKKTRKAAKQLTIEVPKSLTKEFGGITWYGVDNDLFQQNEKRGKRIKVDGGLIVQSKKSHLVYSGIVNGQLRTTYDITVEQLETLLKTAKKKRKALGDCFFVHLSGDLSFFFTKDKK